MKHELIRTTIYLLVVSDEEVKEGDVCLADIPASDFYDVVPYNGAFATHYFKKIIAHRPLNPDHITLKVDLLPPFEEDIKKMAKDWLLKNGWSGHAEHSLVKSWMAEFYNKAKEKYKYTEEDMINFATWRSTTSFDSSYTPLGEFRIWESLQQPKLPIAFECETEEVWVRNTDRNVPTKDDFDTIVKTTTNSEGRTEWVGKYIFN